MKDWKRDRPTRTELAEVLLRQGDAVIMHDMTVLTLISVTRQGDSGRRFSLTVQHVDGSQSELFLMTAD